MRFVAPDLDFASVRAEHALPDDHDEYPPEALAEAVAAASGPDPFGAERIDATDLDLVTIDPPGSMDLDQALCIGEEDGLPVLHYAIADVASWVTPGGALEAESLRRGQTVYLPDGSIPLHPRVLSEDAASLLPGVDRRAVLWTIHLGADGEPADVRLRRATVRSRERFTYAEVQAAADAGTLVPALRHLPAFGAARIASAVRRGAIDLRLPDQEVVRGEDGWRLEWRPSPPVERWNSEASLLVGICAARMMVDAGVGLLRVVPAADETILRRLRATAAALGIEWPEAVSLGRMLDGLAPADPHAMAMMSYARSALRGSDYRALPVPGGVGVGEAPTELVHAGVGSVYAHVTAPLRRLADRFATEVCLAVVRGAAVPEWVGARLPGLGAVMGESSVRAGRVARECVAIAEAVVLEGHVGSTFDAVVLRPARGEGEKRREAEIFVERPAVIDRCAGDPPEGDPVRVRLESVSREERRVRFVWPA